jgi:hypothetical protein
VLELALYSVAVIVAAGLVAVAAYLIFGLVLRAIAGAARRIGSWRHPARP